MDKRLILFGALVFATVVLLVWGLYSGWNNTKGQGAERVARRLRSALGSISGELAVTITKQRAMSSDPAVQRLLERLPGMKALDRLLLQSGRNWQVDKLLKIMAGVAAVAFIGLSLLPLPWLARLLLTGVLAMLPVFDATRAKSRRLERFEEQLPDALDMMNRAMRAGHAFPTTLKMIGEEMPEPLASEFRTVFDEVNFGVAMQDALMNLAVRVPSPDLSYFVVAVLIQRETGGNLTELLTSISRIVRDRIKLMGLVRTVSAEGKLSAWILGLLPFGMGGMISLANPGYLEVLYTDPVGRKMLTMAVVFMVLGVLMIRKITRIRM